VQAEVEADKALRAALGEDEALAAADVAGGSGGMFGFLSFNATAAVSAVVPEAAQAETAAVWSGLTSFLDAQWAPSLVQANAVLVGAAEEARAAEAGTQLDPARRAQLQRESDGDESDDEATALRRRMVAWSKEGPQGRPVLESLLFTFALMKVASEKWKSIS
jgi:hypothetical protein